MITCESEKMMRVDVKMTGCEDEKMVCVDVRVIDCVGEKDAEMQR